jgi:hypothetical protein
MVLIHSFLARPAAQLPPLFLFQGLNGRLNIQKLSFQLLSLVSKALHLLLSSLPNLSFTMSSSEGPADVTAIFILFSPFFFWLEFVWIQFSSEISSSSISNTGPNHIPLYEPRDFFF